MEARDLTRGCKMDEGQKTKDKGQKTKDKRQKAKGKK